MAVSNVRMPNEVYDRLKAWARAEHRSINAMAVDILDRATRRWKAQEALGEARRVRESIRAKHGVLPDSAPAIRQMREKRAKRG